MAATDPQQTLGKAGAGLPKLHALFLRYVGFPLLRLFFSWERAYALFESEGELILKYAKTLNEEALFTKVLVPKIFGIEDNSRYYSAAMVLWHLTYVDRTIRDGILSLSRGENIDFTVKIATYKPFVEIGTDVVGNFEEVLTNFRPTIESQIQKHNIANYHAHPWFGPLNPYGWLVMAALHQRVHRRQLEAILQDLET